MKRFFLALALCLVPALSWAQVSLEGQVLFGNNAVNFKDEALCSSFKKPQAEISGEAIFNKNLRMKYVVSPGFSFTETVVTTQSLVIGNTEFGNEPQKQSGQGGGQQQQPKPVDIQWSTRGMQRLELSGILAKVPHFQPLVMAEWANLLVEGTGKGKDGKLVTDSEEYSRFLVAAGARYHEELFKGAIITDICFAGGKDFNHFEALIAYRIAPCVLVQGGYLSESRNLGSVKWREHGLTLGGEWRF